MADDLIALLDHLVIDSISAMGTSGGGPHVLALAARHPERVSATTVVVGLNPLVPEEVQQLVGVNAQGYALAAQGWPPRRMQDVDQRVWHHEGHFASLTHDKEIVRELISRR